MIAKVIIPTARADLHEKIKAKVGKKAKIISLYRAVTTEEITRQMIVYITNTCPKIITRNDRVYLLAVKHPIMMALLTYRIAKRIESFQRKGDTPRRWYILDYNPRSKKLEEYFLP